MFIGKRVEIRESTEIASVYQELSRKDRLAADCLFQQRLYNEAAYFYIQSMEKRVKEFICKKIDMYPSLTMQICCEELGILWKTPLKF